MSAGRQSLIDLGISNPLYKPYSGVKRISAHLNAYCPVLPALFWHFRFCVDMVRINGVIIMIPHINIESSLIYIKNKIVEIIAVYIIILCEKDLSNFNVEQIYPGAYSKVYWKSSLSSEGQLG